MILAGFEPSIPTADRPQTNALDRAATGSSVSKIRLKKYINRAKFQPTISSYLTKVISSNKRRICGKIYLI
jgi:hypothetical protein